MRGEGRPTGALRFLGGGGGEGSQVKIAWSKSRIGDLEFFRVRREHEAGIDRGKGGGGGERVDFWGGGGGGKGKERRLQREEGKVSGDGVTSYRPGIHSIGVFLFLFSLFPPGKDRVVSVGF